MGLGLHGWSPAGWEQGLGAGDGAPGAGSIGWGKEQGLGLGLHGWGSGWSPAGAGPSAGTWWEQGLGTGTGSIGWGWEQGLRLRSKVG